MSFSEVIAVLANIATVLGIPIAIFLFFNEKRIERREREYGTYDALDEKYIEYLKLCMENPELDLYDLPLGQENALSPAQKIQQFAMFEILVSLFERAFLMYRDQSDRMRQSQWAGWREYMEDYAKRKSFRRLWARRGMEYDSEFMVYLNAIIESVHEEVSEKQQ